MSLIDALRYRLRVLLHPDAYGRELSARSNTTSISKARTSCAAKIAVDTARSASASDERIRNITYATEERRIASGVSVLRRAPPGRTVRVSRPSPAPGVRGRHRRHACAGRRRRDVDFLHRRRRALSPARVSRRRTPDRRLANPARAENASHPRGAMGPDRILASGISRLARDPNILRRAGDLEQQHERRRRD